MVSTLTDIELVSRALSKFGGGAIQSFEEESDLAATCSRVYPGVRDYLLSIHPWYFVTAKRALAESADVTPLNEWGKAFALPANMLAGPMAVFGDGSQRPVHDYELYQNYLYCDYKTVMIDYRLRPSESQFPEWFAEFLATAAAAKLAIPVSDQVSKAEILNIQAFGTPAEQGRGGMFAECRNLNAQFTPLRSLFQNGDPITNARAG